MSLRRFYCPDLSADQVELDAEQAGHARKSLRLAEGREVELFDGAGTVAVGRITELTRRMVVAIGERRRIAPPTPTLDLATAIPKGDRAATLVEAAAQLGVDRLIPLLTDRGVVEPGRKKQDRFDRIAIEAAKQCGRSRLMTIAPPTRLDALLRQTDHDLKLITDTPPAASDDGGVAASAAMTNSADAPAPMQPLQTPDALRSTLSQADRVLVLIGPEGGWTDAERAAATDAGCRVWSFNANVLRVETAALAAAAILRFQAEHKE